MTKLEGLLELHDPSLTHAFILYLVVWVVEIEKHHKFTY